MKASVIWDRMQGETCTVVGLGISNLPLVRFLVTHGLRVTGRDRKERDALGETARELEALGVPLCLGARYLEDLNERVIFRSPGIRPDRPEFLDAIARGALLTSEMELFLELTPATVIGITGSDGKTTTTTLTHRMLSEEERLHPQGRQIWVGGNIGSPLLPQVENMRACDIAVLELSSFQLQTMQHSPAHAALTNLTPNHLNWHTDLSEYADAKCNIFCHAENRRAVINAENAGAVAAAERAVGKVVWMSSAAGRHADAVRFGAPTDRAVFVRDDRICLSDGVTERPVLETSRIRLEGRHNLENYMSAIALTDGMVSEEAIERVASTFEGVPHRFERVRILDGVTYYNSSIDSSPSRTAATLTLVSTPPILICGGSDKGLSMEPLAEAIVRHCKAVILTGQTAGKIRAALESQPRIRSGEIPVYDASGFVEAVETARAVAVRGDIVLLSPACASFDAFPNFEVRGETFRRVVEGFVENEHS